MKKVNMSSISNKIKFIYADECEKNTVGIVIFSDGTDYYFDSEYKNKMLDEEVEALLLRGAAIFKDGKYYKPTSFNVENVSFGGEGSSQVKEVIQSTNVKVSSGNDVQLDSSVIDQTASIIWDIEDGDVAFDNIFVYDDSKALPRVLVNYNSPWKEYAPSDIKVENKYFYATNVTSSEDAVYSWSSNSTHAKVDDGDWCYRIVHLSTVGSSCSFLSLTAGTVTLNYAYAIDINDEFKNNADINYYISKYGYKKIVPGEDYTPSDQTVTLTCIKNGETIDTSVYPDSDIDITSDSVLSISSNSAKLSVQYKTYVSGGSTSTVNTKIFEGKKWAVIGDSITDPTINATIKYHKIISEQTGISVETFGLGGTGYKRTEEVGTCFYQRAANIPEDADIVTIMGSINDWKLLNSYAPGWDDFVEGEKDDTIEDNSLCGYINKTIDVIQEKAPNAVIGLISPPPSALPNYVRDRIIPCIEKVAKYRHIPFLNLWEVGNLSPENDTLKHIQYTDPESEAMCHPSNVGHARMAPQILNFMKQML